MTLMRLRCLSIALGSLAAASVAYADPEPAADDHVPLALVLGSVTTVVPLAIGASLIATTGDQTTQNAAAYVIESGFTLAPFVAHAIVGEWKRGVFFSLPPAVMMAGMSALLQSNPGVLTSGKLPPQYVFAGLVIGSIFSSAFGVVDAAGAGDRMLAVKSLTLTPMVSQNHVGLGIGGTL